MIILEKETFDELVLDSKEEFILFFHADWAPPSLQLFNEMLEYKDKTLYICDIVELPEKAQIFNVRGVPMLVHMKEGEIVKTQVGYDSRGTVQLLLGEIE